MTISEDLPNQLLVAEVEAPPLTLANLTWRRFRRHKMAIFGAVVLVLLTLYSFGGACSEDELAFFNGKKLCANDAGEIRPARQPDDENDDDHTSAQSAAKDIYVGKLA